MIIHNMLQGSPEWFDIRKGKITGSSASAIASNGKGLETLVKKTFLEYFIEQSNFESESMINGRELEPIARFNFELETGICVNEVGFIEHSKYCGCSPDGLIGDDAVLEIKCRNEMKHFEYLLTDEIESETLWQIQMALAITGRKKGFFVAFNPKFKKSLYIQEIARDEDKIEKIFNGIKKGSNMLEKLFLNKELINKIKY